MAEVPATEILDSGWMRDRLDLARRLYGPATPRVLGTVWWYSTSSVLVAPPIEALLSTGVPLDPALDAVTLRIQADGRLLGASSKRALQGGARELGSAYREALAPAIRSVASASGARERALWAIAADSIANRFLWAGQAVGDPERAIALAEQVALGIGPVMPRPRYVKVGRHTVVRRASCCLIDQATGQQKCTSCPAQRPDERERRITEALG